MVWREGEGVRGGGGGVVEVDWILAFVSINLERGVKGSVCGEEMTARAGC